MKFISYIVYSNEICTNVMKMEWNNFLFYFKIRNLIRKTKKDFYRSCLFIEHKQFTRW